MPSIPDPEIPALTAPAGALVSGLAAADRGGVEADTAFRYQCRFAQLRARYEREQGGWDWAGFVDWLTNRRGELRAASFRQYRAAVIWMLRREGTPGADVLIDRLCVPRFVAPNRTLPARTSSTKAKSISSSDFHHLAVWLQNHGGRWDDLAGTWLYWSTVTGLRPVEWRNATLRANPTSWALVVQNAKHTQGRAHGEDRTIYLQVDVEEAHALQCFLDAVQRDYEKAYQGCRLALHRATKALWPRKTRYPTLYTGRHQFSANAKFSGLTPEQIAALMGHAVTNTHQTHYGKRRCGRGGLMAIADPGDVYRVLERRQIRKGLQSAAPAPVIGE